MDKRNITEMSFDEIFPASEPPAPRTHDDYSVPTENEEFSNQVSSGIDFPQIQQTQPQSAVQSFGPQKPEPYTTVRSYPSAQPGMNASAANFPRSFPTPSAPDQFNGSGFGISEPVEDFSDFDPNRYKDNHIGDASDTTLPAVHNVVSSQNGSAYGIGTGTGNRTGYNSQAYNSPAYSTPGTKTSPLAVQAMAFAILSLVLNMTGILAIIFAIVALNKVSQARKTQSAQERAPEKILKAATAISIFGLSTSIIYTIVMFVSIISS